MADFQTLITNRRSIYALGAKVELTQDEVTKIIQNCLLNAPSAFNSQSARLVVLYGQSYHSFWKMVEGVLQKIVPENSFDVTKRRINSFSSGVGTILFFEDETVIHGLKEKMPTYADRFSIWAEQSNAMLQYMIWSALAEKDIGASLQHYNPLIDVEVHQMFELPLNWRLIAQMPFGSIEASANSKVVDAIEKRFKVFA
ncbi:MAG: nitroreductase family protein [Alphaproteobacteria bacterium]|nr:nitroreductase family protein [Alphaproteobacteria bacterium]